jgi:hypothetical protein
MRTGEGPVFPRAPQTYRAIGLHRCSGWKRAGRYFLNTRFRVQQCPARVSGVKSGSPARASTSAARRIPYAPSTWAACPANRRACSTTGNVRARRGLSRCAAPPARIWHDHASGEESIDDIIRALETGTVRDLHVRELDLSGTEPFPRGAAAPRAQLAPAGAFHFATHHTTVWLSRRRRWACEAGNARVGWSAGGFACEPHLRAVPARYVLMRCFACTAAPGCAPINAMQPARLTSHVCAHVSGEARAAGGCGRRGVCECGQSARRGACYRRHQSRGRRCAGGGAPRQQDAAGALPLQYVDSLAAFIRGNEGPRESASGGESGSCFGSVGRGVCECGECARRAACADNGIKAKGAVALAAALQGNTTLQTLILASMWTARSVSVSGIGGPCRVVGSAPAERCEWLVVLVGVACASAGSELGVVRGAGNGIQAKGAVALAAALKGNTTLQTLDLHSMWTARTRAFCGNGRPLPGPRECAGGEARAAGGCGRRGVRECGQ